MPISSNIWFRSTLLLFREHTFADKIEKGSFSVIYLAVFRLIKSLENINGAGERGKKLKKEENTRKNKLGDTKMNKFKSVELRVQKNRGLFFILKIMVRFIRRRSFQ